MDPELTVDNRGDGAIAFDFAGRRWRARLIGWRTPLTPHPEPADGGPAAEFSVSGHAARHAQKLVNRYYAAGVAGGRS